MADTIEDLHCTKCNANGHVLLDHFAYISVANDMPSEDWHYFAFRIPKGIYNFLMKFWP